MNLIEQLGGYEKTKAEFEALKKYPELYKGEHAKNNLLLLQYRRVNNIYEVGDSIITNDDASNGKVYIIERNSNDVHFKLRSKEGIRYCGRWRIERHATQQEIEAGYGL